MPYNTHLIDKTLHEVGINQEVRCTCGELLLTIAHVRLGNRDMDRAGAAYDKHMIAILDATYVNNFPSAPVKPYKHDCSKCIWVGWISCTKQLGNMYFCPSDPDRSYCGSIIIRFSDEPSDYWSSAVWENASPSDCAIQK